MLHPPCVIVCHDTRYKENSLTGLIRILGIGKFGEFSTFIIERINKQLFGELKLRYRLDLLSPEKDLGLDVQAIASDRRDRKRTISHRCRLDRRTLLGRARYRRVMNHREVDFRKAWWSGLPTRFSRCPMTTWVRTVIH